MAIVSFYAQPTRFEPYLKKKSLKMGKYELGNSDYGAVYITDIGNAVWDLAKSMYPFAVIRGSGFQLGDTNPGTITITTQKLEISFNCISYKILGGPKSIYFLLKLNGDETIIAEFIQNCIKVIGHVPYEMASRDKFTNKTGIQMDMVINTWNYYIQYKLHPKQQSTQIPSSSQPDSGKNVDMGKDDLLELARNYEKALKYEDAAKLYEKLKMWEDAGKVRKLAQQSKTPIAQIVGEKIQFGDDRSVKIKDSPMVRPQIGLESKPIQTPNNCPFCGNKFSFKKTPKFCPYCNEELS